MPLYALLPVSVVVTLAYIAIAGWVHRHATKRGWCCGLPGCPVTGSASLFWPVTVVVMLIAAAWNLGAGE